MFKLHPIDEWLSGALTTQLEQKEHIFAFVLKLYLSFDLYKGWNCRYSVQPNRKLLEIWGLVNLQLENLWKRSVKVAKYCN